jgi:hypothetical protein
MINLIDSALASSIVNPFLNSASKSKVSQSIPLNLGIEDS